MAFFFYDKQGATTMALMLHKLARPGNESRVTEINNCNYLFLWYCNRVIFSIRSSQLSYIDLKYAFLRVFFCIYSNHLFHFFSSSTNCIVTMRIIIFHSLLYQNERSFIQHEKKSRNGNLIRSIDLQEHARSFLNIRE